MNGSKTLNRILCAVLILALAAGAAVAAFTGGRTPPENPLERRAQALNADPVDGGSSSQRREWQEREDTAPEQEDNEPADTLQEEPHKEEQPEDREQPDRKTEPPPSGQTEPGEGQADPDDPELPDRQDDTPGASGDETGPGGGDAAGEDPAAEDPSGGAEDPDVTPGESGITTAIATNCPNGIVTQEELPDGVLAFYAYGTGAEDLSVRITVKNTATRASSWLTSDDGRNWSFSMELGETYQITMYLYQPGRPTQHTARYVTYQASRADEEHPTVGEHPPVITTNIDDMADGAEVRVTDLVLQVTALTDPDRRPITSERISVKLNGVTVRKTGGDSSPEYDLHFEPPNVGDHKDYTIEIVAWDGTSSSRWSKTLRYVSLADGDDAGTVTVVLDATTVGCGVLDTAEYDIKKGDTAADVFLRFLEDYGYEITCDSGGGNFYIRRIHRWDMCRRAAVPADLWNAIRRDGIALNEGQHDRDSLGEFDYTMGAGWMFAVDGAYPGRSMNRFEVKDGSTVSVRFTLSYGKDIGGFASTGGGYGRYSSYCGLWLNGNYQALGHRYGETDRREPTETEDGYVEYTCARCGDTYREILPATGHEHVYEETDRREPTETEDGYVEYTCSVCGDTYREILPATSHEHAYEETDRREPTETEDGYVEYTCGVCGDTYREILPATGHEHTYEETDRREPTETEDGYVEYTCSVCGDTYREVLPATGVHEHVYEETDRREPTETEDGYVEYTCSVCGDTYRVTLPATGPGEGPGPGDGDGGGQEGGGDTP